MRVLGLDCETNGLDHKTHLLTEVGMVLFARDWEPVKITGRLINNPKLYPLPSDIVTLTGITDEMLQGQGESLELVLDCLREFEQFGYDIVVAHNLPFDKDFLMAAFEQTGQDPGHLFLKPWVCSNADVAQHNGKRCRKLSHLAVDYGLTVDGGKLHRAVDDVLLMGAVLKAAGARADDMLAYSMDPWVYIKADTEKPWLDGGASTDLARKDGYGWEKAPGTYGPVFSKQWVKRIKSKELENEKARQVGFSRSVIESKATA